MEIRVKKTVIIILVAALAVLAAVGTVIGIVVSRRGQNPTVTVTVTFVTNGGKEIAPVTLQKGETLTLPTAAKDGRVFADWYSYGNHRGTGRNALRPLRSGFNFCNQRRNGSRAANLL